MIARARQKIVIYADGHASTYSLLQALQETFANQPVDIVEVHKKDFDEENCLDINTIAFILPGTPGGSSAYRDQLGSDGFGQIYDYVCAGGCYLGICAGGYLAFREFEYFDKHTGKLRQISSQLPFSMAVLSDLFHNMLIFGRKKILGPIIPWFALPSEML